MNSAGDMTFLFPQPVESWGGCLLLPLFTLGMMSTDISICLLPFSTPRSHFLLPGILMSVFPLCDGCTPRDRERGGGEELLKIPQNVLTLVFNVATGTSQFLVWVSIRKFCRSRVYKL